MYYSLVYKVFCLYSSTQVLKYDGKCSKTIKTCLTGLFISFWVQAERKETLYRKVLAKKDPSLQKNNGINIQNPELFPEQGMSIVSGPQNLLYLMMIIKEPQDPCSVIFFPCSLFHIFKVFSSSVNSCSETMRQK